MMRWALRMFSGVARLRVRIVTVMSDSDSDCGVTLTRSEVSSSMLYLTAFSINSWVTSASCDDSTLSSRMRSYSDSTNLRTTDTIRVVGAKHMSNEVGNAINCLPGAASLGMNHTRTASYWLLSRP